MPDYTQKTDEELIMAYRDGDEAAIDVIVNRHKGLVRKKAKSMFILGADKDDLIQEGMIGLFKAIRDYDAGRDASFYTFASLCVTRQMYTAASAATRQKHEPLNSYISIYGDEKEDASQSQGPLIEMLVDATDQNPESLIIHKEEIRLKLEKARAELSELEKQVFDLFLTGLSYSEIAKVLGRDEKSTDNTLSRIRGKLKKM